MNLRKVFICTISGFGIFAVVDFLFGSIYRHFLGKPNIYFSILLFISAYVIAHLIDDHIPQKGSYLTG